MAWDAGFPCILSFLISLSWWNEAKKNKDEHFNHFFFFRNIIFKSWQPFCVKVVFLSCRIEFRMNYFSWKHWFPDISRMLNSRHWIFWNFFLNDINLVEGKVYIKRKMTHIWVSLCISLMEMAKASVFLGHQRPKSSPDCPNKNDASPKPLCIGILFCLIFTRMLKWVVQNNSTHLPLK